MTTPIYLAARTARRSEQTPISPVPPGTLQVNAYFCALHLHGAKGSPGDDCYSLTTFNLALRRRSCGGAQPSRQDLMCVPVSHICVCLPTDILRPHHKLRSRILPFAASFYFTELTAVGGPWEILKLGSTQRDYRVQKESERLPKPTRPCVRVRAMSAHRE